MKKREGLSVFREVNLDKIDQKKCRVKLGFDPTSTKLHLGHLVVLNGAKKLQELGHEIIILIGDFTASIGDPTGKNAARPPLSKEEIEKNCETYLEQVFMVLDKDKTTIVRNSDWLSKMSVTDFIKLISTQTIQQIAARDDFSKRLDNNTPVFMHEFIYPIMQGFDSVELKADLELGGQDQWFNLLMGRELQKAAGQTEQSILTFPLLLGLDGVHKMSKSLHNDIGFLESPKDKFGKTMSISDGTMCNWIEVLGLFTEQEKLDLEKISNPKDRKVLLAQKVVEEFHGVEEALKQKEMFELQFKKKDIAEVLNQKDFLVVKVEDLVNGDSSGVVSDKVSLAQIMTFLKMTGSNSEAVRKMKEGAVKVDGEKVSSNLFFPKFDLGAFEFVLEFGKKHVEKIRFCPNSPMSKESLGEVEKMKRPKV